MAKFALTDDSSLYILLPRQNKIADLQQVEQRMTDTAVRQMIEHMKSADPQHIEVTLPQIKLDAEPDMHMLLKKLGLFYLLCSFLSAKINICLLLPHIKYHSLAQPSFLIFLFLFPKQVCCHSLTMQTFVASTLKTSWFWKVQNTKPSLHSQKKEWRPVLSPVCHSLAPSRPSLPCGLSSCCCGVTRPMCHSSLAE